MARSKKSSAKAKPGVRRMRLRSDACRRSEEEDSSSSSESPSRRRHVTKRKETKPSSSRRSRSTSSSSSNSSLGSYVLPETVYESGTESESSRRSRSSASERSASSDREKTPKKSAVKKTNPAKKEDPKKRKKKSSVRMKNKSRVEDKRGSGSLNESVDGAHDGKDLSKIAHNMDLPHSPDISSGRTSTPIRKDTLYKRSFLNRARSAQIDTAARSPQPSTSALPSMPRDRRSPIRAPPPSPSTRNRYRSRSLALDAVLCEFQLPILVESIQKVHVSPKEEKITIETKTILVSCKILDNSRLHMDQENMFKVRPTVSHVNSEQEKGRNEEVSEHTVLLGKKTVLVQGTTVLRRAELNNNMTNESKKEYNRVGKCRVNEVTGPLSIHCAQGTVVVDDIYQKKELISVFLAAEPQMKKKEELAKILSKRLIREEIPEMPAQKVQSAEKLMSTGKYVLMLEREVRIQCNDEMWTNENDYVTTEKRSFKFGKNPYGEMRIVETGHNIGKSIVDINPSLLNRSAHVNKSLALPHMAQSPSTALVQNVIRTVDRKRNRSPQRPPIVKTPPRKTQQNETQAKSPAKNNETPGAGTKPSSSRRSRSTSSSSSNSSLGSYVLPETVYESGTESESSRRSRSSASERISSSDREKTPKKSAVKKTNPAKKEDPKKKKKKSTVRMKNKRHVVVSKKDRHRSNSKKRSGRHSPDISSGRTSCNDCLENRRLIAQHRECEQELKRKLAEKENDLVHIHTEIRKLGKTSDKLSEKLKEKQLDQCKANMTANLEKRKLLTEELSAKDKEIAELKQMLENDGKTYYLAEKSPSLTRTDKNSNN